MKALIVDDEPNARGVMTQLLERCNTAFDTIDLAESVAEASMRLERNTYDFLFLDIRLNDGTGFQLLESSDDGKWRHLIFTTAYDEFAIKAFKFSASDYLLKPFGLKDLNEAINRCLNRAEQQTQWQPVAETMSNAKFDTLTLPTPQGQEGFQLDQILYIESETNYSIFHFADHNRIVVAKTLKYYEDLLSKHGFVRTHRSYLVNGSKIKTLCQMTEGMLKLDTGSEIPVSRRRFRDVSAHLAQLR